MNILMISTDRAVFKEGSPVRARMIEYGSLAGHLDIIIFSLKTQGFSAEDISPQVRIIPTNSSRRLSYLRDAVRIAKGLSAPDVITAQDPFETGIVGVRLSKFFKKPLQVQIHTDLLSPFFRRESFLNRIRMRLIRRTLPQAAGIRAVSKRIADSLLAIDPTLASKIKVLPIFVDTEKIRMHVPTIDLHKKYPNFTFIVLMASRLATEKNIALALQAMKRVIEHRPDAGLVIVGDGPEKNDLETKARKLGLEKNVAFEPWQGDMASYYKTADIFLLTSLYEGYGLTLVEAVAAGTPIVSTDVGIAAEILGPFAGTLVCKVGDAAGLEAAMLHVIKTPGFKKDFQAYAERYTKEHAITRKQYLEQYRALWAELM